MSKQVKVQPVREVDVYSSRRGADSAKSELAHMEARAKKAEADRDLQLVAVRQTEALAERHRRETLRIGNLLNYSESQALELAQQMLDLDGYTDVIPHYFVNLAQAVVDAAKEHKG